MYEQISIFDWMPTLRKEPEVGEWVTEHGQAIPHIMRRSYIGRKVVMDKSTQSMKAYKVGILEKVVTDFYWHGEEKVECDRSIVFDGGKQRNHILHMPGQEIFECLPWDAYPERMNSIGKAKK